MKSAHKDIKNSPGQLVNHPKCASASQGGCYCDGSCLSEKEIVKDRTLKDYIIRKQESDGFFPPFDGVEEAQMAERRRIKK